jgi:UDP-glucose 4-epimerase
MTMRTKGHYLVTGGLGFLGAPLVQRLVREGNRVRILDNHSRGKQERLGEVADDVEVISGDIRDAAIVDRASRNIDCVCHLAFVNGTRHFYEKPAYVLDVGVKGMVNVLDACIRRNVSELILASSSEVYQSPPEMPTDETVPLAVPDVLNPRYSYGGGKIISELMAVNYGRDYFRRVVIFRPHNVFGPNMGWDHVIPQLVTHMSRIKRPASDSTVDFPIQGTGEQTRAFIYIDDFTTALMLTIAQGEHLNIYHIGTMEERTIAEVTEKIASELGLNIRVIPGPEAPGGTNRRCPAIERIARLGFKPAWKFEDALSLTVQWYLGNIPKTARDNPASPLVFLKDVQ